jgi:hypothetical protein
MHGTLPLPRCCVYGASGAVSESRITRPRSVEKPSFVVPPLVGQGVPTELKKVGCLLQVIYRCLLQVIYIGRL